MARGNPKVTKVDVTKNNPKWVNGAQPAPTTVVWPKPASATSGVPLPTDVPG